MIVKYELRQGKCVVCKVGYRWPVKLMRLKDAYCPECGKIIIQRVGYFITSNHLDEGRCPFCGEKIPGIWE